jgi:uncharacterized protein (DUF488 family)
VRVFTIGHGARPLAELLELLAGAGVGTLVDVRRFPGSRRHPQFGQERLRDALAEHGVDYLHEVELGGRRRGEPGEERFACLRVAAFRSYAARMNRRTWQEALERSLAAPSPCFLCAETAWQQCHRRLIADLLWARGVDVAHIVRPHAVERHRPWDEAEARGGRLYLCGRLVA